MATSAAAAMARGGIGYYAIVFVLDMVFGLFASMIAMWFSRHREFRADAGGATAGRPRQDGRRARTPGAEPRPEHAAEAGAAFGISGGDGGGLKRLLMSHPPLDERIAALRRLQIDGSAMRQGVVA